VGIAAGDGYMSYFKFLTLGLALMSCSFDKKSASSVTGGLSPQPPTLKVLIESSEKIPHIAAMVDGVPNYKPLLLEGNVVGFSCSADTSSVLHKVIILDHSPIPEPVVIGSQAPNQHYSEASISKGFEAIPRLTPLREFEVSGAFDSKQLTLKYTLSESRQLSVIERVEDRP
jgi:hypothetical protein